ncbi:response regulator transcription factor [Variovorax sp. RA8]|uniref:response regulator transcription factor n=1 Tax=Variovorax sp. (strain JCM 16519 / RA8) TaxID=662548 RepID=UPI001318D1E4|nr:response regulator transcription factor [Variovorax sp. RA8]VTU15423.1 two component system sensor kinase SsrB [Variovorax sp. RA8]
MSDRRAENPRRRVSSQGPALAAPLAGQECAAEARSAVAVVVGVASPALACSLESLVDGTEGLVFRGSAPTTDRLLACCMEAGDCIALVDPALGPQGLRAFMQLLRMMAAGVRVVVISDMHSPHMLREAIRWGASGFVEREAPPAEIRAALVAAARSQRYLSPRMAEDLADSFVLRELTPRESRALAVLTHGDCNKLISSLHPNWR